jgi:hypothetical protein
MGSNFNDRPECSVQAFTSNSAPFGFHTFEGDRALSNANEYFESLKQILEAHEVWMTRRDGDTWMFVEKIQRDAAGRWRSVKAPE